MPRSRDAAQQPAQGDLVGAHQPGGRLIEQQHARTHRERARDLDQAAVDMRQVAGRRRQRALIADKGEQRLRRPRSLRLVAEPDEHAAEPAAAQRDQHVVEDAHGVEQLGGLIGARDAGAGDLPGRQAGEFLAAEPDAAAVRHDRSRR